MAREYEYRKTVVVRCKDREVASTRIKTIRIPNKDAILIPVSTPEGSKCIIVYIKSKRVYLKDQRS